MGVQGVKDVLDLFNDLPDYPGRRLPKNRPDTPPAAKTDPFAGVPSRTMQVGGEARQFYTVGNVARILGRTAQTLRKWERKGWIPPATYRTAKSSGSALLNAQSRGYRLYSREQVELLLQGLELFNLDGGRTKDWQKTSHWVSFIDYIKKNWPR